MYFLIFNLNASWITRCCSDEMENTGEIMKIEKKKKGFYAACTFPMRQFKKLKFKISGKSGFPSKICLNLKNCITDSRTIFWRLMWLFLFQYWFWFLALTFEHILVVNIEQNIEWKEKLQNLSKIGDLIEHLQVYFSFDIGMKFLQRSVLEF